MAEPFLDTNVLLYLLSADTEKADRAAALLKARAVISVQVLNEFVSVARRKANLPWRELHEFLGTFKANLRVEALTLEAHDRAVAISERYRLSFYDAQIVASALIADCQVLYSEDMQHGLILDRALTVRNPFRAA